MVQISYDGTYMGLLSVIFEIYDRKITDVQIVRAKFSEGLILQENIQIGSDENKAKRVFEGLRKKISSKTLKNLYRCFLSDLNGIENTIFKFVQYVFSETKNVETNFGNGNVLMISQVAKKVEREKHRFEAFVRFENIGNDLFYASIDPDYNVLPLITSHFKSRYANQDWIIYDVKRRYGIHYTKINEAITEVVLTFKSEKNGNIPTDRVFDKDEKLYRDLWRNYFKSATIGTRKNLKLHVQHVPKRYWKYLVEKQPNYF